MSNQQLHPVFYLSLDEAQTIWEAAATITMTTVPLPTMPDRVTEFVSLADSIYINGVL